MAYKDILDNIEWSFSTLHQYEQCPYSFYEKKLDGTEINEGNFYSDIGGFVHEINAQIFDETLSIDNAIDYFIDNYENNVVYTAKQSTMENKYNQAIDYLAAFDVDKLNDYEILGVEKEVHFKVDKYKFIGFIDLLLRNKETKKIILVDHKSADHFMKKDGVTPLKNQKENFEAYRRQMYLYCKAINDEYGEFPDRIVWSHFFEQTVTNIKFVEEDYENTLKWAVNTIKNIYSDKEFKANTSYMMCNVLCGYRNSCCYANDEGGE